MESKVTIPVTGARVSARDGERLWESIKRYPMPFRANYLQFKHGWSEKFSNQAIDAYKKFTFLAYIASEEMTPSQHVDEVWHLHILHTAAYQKFSTLCGRFLHHSPGMPDERPRFAGQYQRTLAFYREVFGEEPLAMVWPR